MDMPWPPSPPQNPWAQMPAPWPPSPPAPGPTPPKPPTQAELDAAAAQSDVNGAWGANGVPGGFWGMLARKQMVEDQQKESNLGALRQADDNASFVGPPDGLAGSAGGDAPPPGMAAALAALSPAAGAGGQPAPAAGVPRGAGGAAAPQARDLSSMLDARSLEALKAQGLSVGAMQEKLAKLQGQALPTDFRPLAGLVDAWTGSKMSATAAPSETAEQRRASIAQLQQEILKGQQGMSQDELGMLKTKLQAQFHEDEIAARERERQASLENARLMHHAMTQQHQDYHDQTTFTKAASALTGADEFKKPLQQAEDMDKFASMIESAKTNPMSRATLNLENIKQFVNRVSQGELEAVKGGEAKGLQNKAEQLYKDLTTGGLTDANVDVMHDFAKTLREANDKTLKNAMDRHAQIYMSTPGVTKRDLPEVADAISGGLYSKVNGRIQGAEKVEGAKRWLADPKNANDPRRAQIQGLVQ